jgi:hypothetical protein
VQRPAAAVWKGIIPGNHPHRCQSACKSDPTSAREKDPGDGRSGSSPGSMEEPRVAHELTQRTRATSLRRPRSGASETASRGHAGEAMVEEMKHLCPDFADMTISKLARQ